MFLDSRNLKKNSKLKSYRKNECKEMVEGQKKTRNKNVYDLRH